MLFYSDTKTGLSIQSLLQSGVSKYHENDNMRELMDYLQTNVSSEFFLHIRGCTKMKNSLFSWAVVALPRKGTKIGIITHFTIAHHRTLHRNNAEYHHRVVKSPPPLH